MHRIDWRRLGLSKQADNGVWIGGKASGFTEAWELLGAGKSSAPGPRSGVGFAAAAMVRGLIRGCAHDAAGDPRIVVCPYCYCSPGPFRDASARVMISLMTSVLASAYCCTYFQSRAAS